MLRKRGALRAFLNAEFIVASLLLAGTVSAKFGTDGMVVTTFGGSACAQSLLLQPDGKLVAGGYSYDGQSNFTLVRYHQDGSLDTEFGSENSGKVRTFLGGNTPASIAAMVLQPDGKIVATGTGTVYCGTYPWQMYAIVMARYLNTGLPDEGFGDSGVRIFPKEANSYHGNSMQLRADGKIFIAGMENPSAPSPWGFLVAEFSNAGDLESAFGKGGISTVYIGSWNYGPPSNFGGTKACANSLILLQNGKLVATGDCTVGTGVSSSFALARFGPDGNLDLSFGDGGKVITAIGESDAATCLVQQPDEKIVVAGRSSVGSKSDFVLVRYNSDGTLDGNFGDGGKVRISIGAGSASAQSLVLQPDGKLVAAGYCSNGNNLDFAIVRTNNNGSLDSGFGDFGKAITAIGEGDDAANSLILQPDGMIVAAGYSQHNGFRCFALARYTAQGILDAQLTTVANPDLSMLSPTPVVPVFPEGGYASPNPFLPGRGQRTFFNYRFENPNATYAIRIYNLRGQFQRTLTDTREWNGRSESGHLCEGGVYIYQIEAEGKRVTGKVVLIK